MRFLTWIYCAVVLGLLVWLTQLVLRSASTDPRALIEGAIRRSSGPEMDTRRALADLELALSTAEAARDDALIEQALLARARLLSYTGGLTQARSDLERVLTYYRPGSAAIESMLAEIVLKSGETDDALARSDGILAKDPSQTTAWSVRARALIEIARRHIDAASRAAGTALADQGYANGQELMRNIAALDRADPDRARRVDTLVERFSGGDKTRAGEVLEHLDLASDALTQVPQALAQSFRGWVDREAMRDYLSLLRDAGRDEAAIDFGLAVRNNHQVRDWPPFLTELMRSLLERGRPELALELISPNIGKMAAPDADFYTTWCVALYRAKRWKALGGVTGLVRASGDPAHRAASNFFLGIAQTRLQQYDDAAITLGRFTQHPDMEPIPGAVPIAWQAISEGHRAHEKFDEERITLQARLKLAPDRYDGVGEAWQRLSELWLEARPPNRNQGFESLTQALRLSPRRRAELEPLWRQLGEQILTSAQIDVVAERESLDRANAALPEGITNAYQILRHAELLSERGNQAGAALACWRVLELYPDFLPALDVYIDATTKTGDYRTAARWLRRRVELAGLDAQTLKRMTALPRDQLGSEWTLELVRLDPDHTGRRAAADLLRKQGRTSEALFNLELIRPDELDSEGCLLAASLAYELGRYDEAYDLLARLPTDIDVLAKALPLALDLGVRSRDVGHLSNLMRLLDLRVEPDVDRLVACADHMLIAGVPSSATELCTLLDARPRWRTGAVFTRLAQAAMLSGDGESAGEHLERAGAYDATGAPELGEVIRAVDARSWSTLPGRIADLQASEFKPNTLQSIALDVLGEHLLDAKDRVAKARVDQPDEPLWTLLDASIATLAGEASPDAENGSDSAASVFVFGVTAQGKPSRDPRALLARLVALGHPEWTSWAIADLQRSEPPQVGALWPNYLAGRGYEQLARYSDAERLAKASIAAWPTFAPAWDLLESVISAQVKRPDHPKLLALAAQRHAALGVDDSERVDELLAQARVLDSKDQSDKALSTVEAALELDPRRGQAQRLRAQILRHRGEWRHAIDAFHAALADAPAISDSHPVVEFIEALGEAARAEPAIASDGTVERELAFLSKRFDRDPRVALAYAELALLPNKLADRSAQALAVDRLAEFRRRTEGVALEELRPGAARAWVDFLARFDGERARQLVKDELAYQPGSIDLWRLLGITSADAGDLDAAIAALETAQRMLPDGATARRLAELYGDRGDETDVVRRAVSDASRFERVRPDDPRLQWTLARALVRGNVNDLGEGITILAKLWDARDAEHEPEAVGRVGDTYGIALCRRNQPGDGQLAQTVLTEAAPRVTDPSRRNLIEALASIARTLDGK